VAILLAALLLVSSVLAASPALHHRLHRHSSQDSHPCAVTMLEKQQVLLEAGPVIFLVFEFGVVRAGPQRASAALPCAPMPFICTRGPPFRLG
jgi:hypothetical protein